MDTSEPASATPDEADRSPRGEGVPRPDERDGEETTPVLKWPPMRSCGASAVENPDALRGLRWE